MRFEKSCTNQRRRRGGVEEGGTMIEERNQKVKREIGMGEKTEAKTTTKTNPTAVAGSRTMVVTKRKRALTFVSIEVFVWGMLQQEP